MNNFLNAWYVDTAELCGGGITAPKSPQPPFAKGEYDAACVRNSDGSYDIEMTIEFFPQRWFYLGLLISGITLFGCLGYLGYDWRKKRKLKKVS